MSIQWTLLELLIGIVIGRAAYKFTHKLVVKGMFKEYVLAAKSKSGSAEEFLETSKIAIITKSVSSGDSIRDSKLRGVFFRVFNTDTIKGKIKEAGSGKGTLALEMNAEINTIPYKYYLTQDTIVLSTT